MAPWIPVFAIAASLGYSAALLARRQAHRHFARTGSESAGPRRPREARRAAKVPETAPDVAEPDYTPMVRARRADLLRYSKNNYVLSRPRDVRIPPLVDPVDFFRLRTLSEPEDPVSPSLSFSLMFPGAGRRLAEAFVYTETELAMAVYAETRGLYPRRIARGSLYDTNLWMTGFEPGCFGDLALARRMVAETRKGNKRTHLLPEPRASDRPGLLAWAVCADAAADAATGRLFTLPPGMRLHFFIRQKDVGRQKPGYLNGYEPTMSFGPFMNVGGGDVPAGENAYIDFYVLPAR